MMFSDDQGDKVAESVMRTALSLRMFLQLSDGKKIRGLFQTFFPAENAPSRRDNDSFSSSIARRLSSSAGFYSRGLRSSGKPRPGMS